VRVIHSFNPQFPLTMTVFKFPLTLILSPSGERKLVKERMI
jgi:hypothetical protein